ncbi:DUF3592 domain-containing protein [Flavihumibacter sp. R14]|nr:DUF3592 domain-containing protein [Flavihumibacter soli]
MWNRQIIFLSLVALTIGWVLWRRGKHLLKKWKKSEAMVVSNKYTPNEFALFESIDPVRDETGTYHAVVEFKTDKGQTIKKQLDIGGNPPRPVGQRMLVIYDPNNPLNFLTDHRTKLEIIPRILVALGLIGLLVSIADLFGVISIISD